MSQMKLDIEKLRQLERAATQVVAWYPRGPEQVIKGPYNRWFKCLGPDQAEVQRGRKVLASMTDDIEYCAAAMNAVPQLLACVDAADKLVEFCLHAIELGYFGEGSTLRLIQDALGGYEKAKECS